MTTFFWIVWTIDIIILAVWGLEAILTNSSYGLVFLLAAIVGTSWHLRVSHPTWALSIAGLPAGILLMFVIGITIAFLKGNIDWK